MLNIERIIDETARKVGQTFHFIVGFKKYGFQSKRTASIKVILPSPLFLILSSNIIFILNYFTSALLNKYERPHTFSAQKPIASASGMTY
jgi:hypothetical protein